MTNGTMNWPTKPLGKVAKIERTSVSPGNIRNGSLYVGLENITGAGVFDNVREVANGELASNKFAFTANHVLYGKLRPYLSKIARPDFAGICSTDILPVLPGKEIDRDFLYYFLRQPEMVQHATSLSTGANLPRLSPTLLAQFLIPLPNLEEQKRITAILDKSDAIRHKRMEAILALEALRLARFYQVFGSPASNEFGWDTPSVGNALEKGTLVEIQDGNHGNDHPKVAEFQTEGVPFIAANCLTNNRLNLEDCPRLSESRTAQLRIGFARAYDVLLTHKASLGMTCVVPEDIELIMLTPQVTYYRCNPDVLNPYFLSTYFQTEFFQSNLERRGKQSTRSYIGITRQKDLPLIVPPINLQNDFASFVKKLDQTISDYEASLTEAANMFNSLEQRAFTGEL